MAIAFGSALLRSRVEPVEDAPIVAARIVEPSRAPVDVERVPVAVEEPKKSAPAATKRESGARIAKIEVGPSLDVAEAERAVRARSRELVSCVQRANATDKAIFVTLMSGRTVVTVRPDNASFADCVRPIVSAMSLPKPNAQFSTVTIRFARGIQD